MEIYHKDAIAAAVGLNQESLQVIRDAFTALGRGQVTMPPILSMDIAEHNGEVDVKTAHIHGWDRFAIKISPGFFDNPKLGLPSLNGLMVLFSAHTGLVEAVLFDEGYLTDIRTALAGAVAADALAQPQADTVAVVGAGLQARLQVQALRLVRPIKAVQVWARDGAKAAAFAQQLAADTGLAVSPQPTVAAACANAQVLITCTPATAALVQWDDLTAGIHVTAMGSDNPHKRELAPQVLRNADLLVVDRLSQSQSAGELKGMDSAGLTVWELGCLLADAKTLRTDARQISICDLSGTGVQDTAIAGYAAQKLA